MAIITASGTIVQIGPSATPETAFDTLAEMQAVSGWTPIGLIESVGEFGDQNNDVTFSAIGDSRVRHAKGAADAGTMALVCAHDPFDAGQQALELAQQTNLNYLFRVTLPDSPGTPFTNTDIFFRGLVSSRRKNIGTNDNVVRNNYNVLVNSPLYVAPSVSA
jgi:Phage tail tube protein, TTP